MRSKKEETRRDRAEWAQRVRDGLVIRVGAFGSLKSYPTAEMRDRAIAELRAGGIIAEIVHA